MSILRYFLEWESKFPNKILFNQPVDGKYITWTFHEAGNEIRRIVSGIQSLGLKPGDHVALLSKNCAHWIMADLAMMMGGYVSVPIYPTLTANTIQKILKHSDSKAIIVGKLDNYNAQKPGIPSEVPIIAIELFHVDEDIIWEDWVKNMPLSNYVHPWEDEDMFTIIYTSGTTGRPKGVMHKIGAVDTTIKVAVEDLGVINDGSGRMFSYLPLSHIAERAGVEALGIFTGASFTFAESLETFPSNLADTQPTSFFAVPRIWAKFREKIEEKLPPAKLQRLLKIPILNSIIKKSIRKKLGLSIATHIFSGAAPITVDMLKWFEKLDIQILQAYGMTEDCVYAHFNRRNANKHGTVGLPLKGLLRKISKEGEIRVKSPALTLGYYKEPELTKALFDEEGYLRTGDLGEIDQEGFLSITGRSKDQFKTEKGKYISPEPIEMELISHPEIEAACVVGIGIPQPIALVTLSQTGKEKNKDKVKQNLNAFLKILNSMLEGHERIAKVIIMKEDWTIENDLLTPTMKVKRNLLEQRFNNQYSLWYNINDNIIWEE
ncbi:MAG TPA: AMP-binding protein [Saprospiraceae bacterium]|nr:AMP-binding protein [Saprospiraceae bacterium]